MYVRLLVDKMAMGKFFPRELLFFPVVFVPVLDRRYTTVAIDGVVKGATLCINIYSRLLLEKLILAQLF
jgi:hypothetical protein